MKSRDDPRHKDRIKTMQSLFSYSFQNSQLLSPKALLMLKHLASIDPIIEEAAPAFPVDKIAKVDLAILRLAIYELIFEKKVPWKVIIDEAVELAKEFGGETSSAFVNGVLGKVLKNYGREGI